MRRSITTVSAVMAANPARLTASAGAQPQAAISEIDPKFGVADHHGRLQAPSAEPMMKKASVTNMRELPPPAVYSVPDAQPPPSCMPSPNKNAPTRTDTP